SMDPEAVAVRLAQLTAATEEYHKTVAQVVEAEKIVEAAEECPVDVIKFETTGVEVSAEEPVAKAADTEKSASPEAPTSEADAAIAALSRKTVPEAPEGPVDPAIHALLQAVTARGGSDIIVGSTSNARAALDSLGKKTFNELPPDARYARVLESARELDKADPGAKGVSRREFVNKAVLTVGWVSLGGTIAVSAGPAFARFMMPNVLEEPDPRVHIGPREKYVAMEPGQVNEDHKKDNIWIIRLDDRFAALSTVCTHLGCIPNWLENDRKFKCPCHGSGFKQSGINFEGPTPRPLERFRIFVEDGLVVVDKSKKYQHELGQWNQVGSFLTV
ncbi:MAG: Rieske 2Fe-2S domain-containing protein, partial [Planctomycetes bacterium]|nr:Rieske 2Fe-2S domain-containing protein [Planctomycetota bacterium]